MNNNIEYFPARWSPLVIGISAVTSVVCVGVSLGMFWIGRDIPFWIKPLPLALVLIAALFTVRGYTLTSESILVHRLFWKTRLPFTGLQSVEFKPDVLRKSLRLFGNGGMYSISGLYRSKALGFYRAFATHLHDTVVLYYSSRIVVVSPDTPEEFVRQVERMIKTDD